MLASLFRWKEVIPKKKLYIDENHSQMRVHIQNLINNRSPLMDVINLSFRTGQRQKENKVLKGLEKVKERRLREKTSLLITSSLILAQFYRNQKVPQPKDHKTARRWQTGSGPGTGLNTTCKCPLTMPKDFQPFISNHRHSIKVMTVIYIYHSL